MNSMSRRIFVAALPLMAVALASPLARKAIRQQKIALTRRIERVYIPNNKHALKGLARQFCAISPRL